jgi:hypothetical protein
MIETHIDFLKWQVREYNKIVKPANGFVCDACKNRRYFAFIDQAGNFALKACTCQNVIAAKQAEEKAQKGRKNVQ